MVRISSRRDYFLAVALVLCAGSAMAQGEYAGSNKCKTCHEEIYKTWERSAHRNTVHVLSPGNDTVIADWRGEAKLREGKIPEVTIRLNVAPENNHLVTLVDAGDPSRSLTFTVVRTQGVGWIKGQQYHVKIGKNYYVLPFIWVPASSAFEAYFLRDWYDEDGSLHQPSAERTWAVTCSGCHQTGVDLVESGDGYEVTYTDLSIACEKCHGPGAGHVLAPKDNGKIINPRRLPYERQMDVCNQCHSVGGGKSVPTGRMNFPWDEEKHRGYQIGEPLTAYYRPVGSPLVQENGEPIVLHTYHSGSKSKHHAAQTGCIDCHNPHGGPARSQLVRSESDNSLCLDCHEKEDAFASPAGIMQHTGHLYAPAVSGASRCTGCHYIASRREKTPSDLPGLGVSAGFLGVVTPRQSLEMFRKDPSIEHINSCNRCHDEWGHDEDGYVTGVQAYAALFEMRPDD